MLPICDHPERLGARVYLALQVDCACCTFYRGVALGFIVALLMAGAAALIYRVF